EFKIQTATYSAEFGRAGGGVINVASRSGANEFHGVGYGFLQSQILNANSWSNNRTRVPKGKFQYDLFGGALGGRIKRDRTFFFVNYEGLRQGSPNNFLATVPLSSWKTGNFSNAFDSQGRLDVIYDPDTTRSNGAGGYIRDAFPGNAIPGNRIHPISANVVKFYPDPNIQGQVFGQLNNFLKTGKNVQNVDTWFTRLDHYISGKHRIFGHFGGAQDSRFPLGLIDQAFPRTAVSSYPTRNAGIVLTSSFTPNFLGEFRISYTRLQSATVPTSAGFSMANLGFPSSLANQVAYKQFPEIDVNQYYTSSGLTVSTFNAPEVSCLGVGQGCGTSASLNPQDTWHALYQVIWIHGRHQIKAGADF